MINRAYYTNSIEGFINEESVNILGHLNANHEFKIEELQKNAWIKQIEILKDQLSNLKGHIYFEFGIPRMGKRVDNIVIVGDCVFVIEFKVGASSYLYQDEEQVIDYALDLKNFHEGSHSARLIPLLVATEAKSYSNNLDRVLNLDSAAKCNKFDIKNTINLYHTLSQEKIDVDYWQNSLYKPTPTIVEAAQALYKNHNVDEITRSDSGAINLSRTSDCINQIIEKSKNQNLKSICFVTGVPGAGKTLAGLNIANERMKADENENAVFLSGNGPLVEVLREALSRDTVQVSKEKGLSISKKEAQRKTNTFIQNIHHFRDEYLKDQSKPAEKVVVFDEAQRAWTKEQASSFMKRRKGIEDFQISEPEFLIEVMNRHSDWCTIVCLIGGGQEINIGEAGLSEWIGSLKDRFTNWNIYFSELIVEHKNYLKSKELSSWLSNNGTARRDLHLSVSIRSFRSENLSQFIFHLLELNKEKAFALYQELKEVYPILMTRDLSKAKTWLKNMAKGSERTGIVSSSGARRLRAFGIDVKNDLSAPNWFLNGKKDVRSSYFLEEIATEFDIQGLEIDWACVAWGANFYFQEGDWNYQKFKGTKWQNIRKEIDKDYLKNTYRVLLTRARQGMIIYIPEGSIEDKTRLSAYYDHTFNYLKSIGINEI